MNPDRIDITMTATLRPKLVRKTLSSFCKNLFRDRERFRLILNVDCVGLDVSPFEVADVCREFFDVVIYEEASPSFFNAMIRNWSRVSSTYFFNLEDDWKLKRKIDIDDMLRILEEHPEYYMVRLGKMKLEKGFAKGDGFISVPDYLFSANPSLLRWSFAEDVLMKIKDGMAFETQLRHDDVNPNPPLMEFMKTKRYCILGEPGWSPVICDIGTKWRQKHGIGKTQGKIRQFRWVK